MFKKRTTNYFLYKYKTQSTAYNLNAYTLPGGTIVATTPVGVRWSLTNLPSSVKDKLVAMYRYYRLKKVKCVFKPAFQRPVLGQAFSTRQAYQPWTGNVANPPGPQPQAVVPNHDYLNDVAMLDTPLLVYPCQDLTEISELVADNNGYERLRIDVNTRVISCYKAGHVWIKPAISVPVYADPQVGQNQVQYSPWCDTESSDAVNHFGVVYTADVTAIQGQVLDPGYGRPQKWQVYFELYFEFKKLYLHDT